MMSSSGTAAARAERTRWLVAEQAVVEHDRADLDELLDALLELARADDRAQIGEVGGEDLRALGQRLPGVQQPAVDGLGLVVDRAHLGRRVLLGDEADERRRRFACHQRGRTWKWPSPPTEPASQPPASSRNSACGSRIAPKALR